MRFWASAACQQARHTKQQTRQLRKRTTLFIASPGEGEPRTPLVQTRHAPAPCLLDLESTCLVWFARRANETCKPKCVCLAARRCVEHRGDRQNEEQTSLRENCLYGR